jgi:hypothetical protein
MGTRGPDADPNTVLLKTNIPTEFDRALTQLVELSGVAKATLVRKGLADLLSTLGMVYPELADSLNTPRKTAGRVRPASMTRKKN